MKAFHKSAAGALCLFLSVLLTDGGMVYADDTRLDVTVPDGNITFCESHTSYPGTKAFDNGSLSDESRWLASGKALPNAWIRYDFDSPVTINGYSITGFSSSNSGLKRDPKSWTLDASSDGTAWEVLDMRTNQTGWASTEKRVFEFDNDRQFSAYRITITENNGVTDYTGFLEAELYADPASPGVPIVRTAGDDPYYPGRARLSATLLSGGSAEVTFLWGTSPDNMRNSASLHLNAPETEDVEITGLEMMETYYWTAYAQNEFGEGMADATNSFVSSAGYDMTRPDGEISGTSGHVDYPPYKAFDDGGSVEKSRWLPNASDVPDVWIQYDFSDGPRILKAYSVTGLGSSNYQTRSPKSWTLSASDSGDDWVVLDARAGQTGWSEYEVRTFKVSNTQPFSRYRFTITENNGATDYTGICELELFGIPDFVNEPEVLLKSVENIAGGTVTLNGELSAGGSAEITVIWGLSPESMSNTNHLGTVFQGDFSHTISGLTPFETYYFLISASNTEGESVSGDGVPVRAVAPGEHFKWVGGRTGEWEDAANWSPSIRSPGMPGDVVIIDAITTITVNSEKISLGGLRLSGPYAQGSIIVTNSPGKTTEIVFNNPAGAAFIEAGGAAPYHLFADVRTETDLEFSSNSSWPVYLHGELCGTGKFKILTDSRIQLAPVSDITVDSMLLAEDSLSYCSLGPSCGGTVTFTGDNVMSFHGDWSDHTCFLKTGTSAIFDGGTTTNLNASTLPKITDDSTTDARFVITNGAKVINITSKGEPRICGYRNSVTVCGHGSMWDAAGGEMKVFHGTNSVSVTDGASVVNARLSFRGSNGRLTVSGSGTVWDAGGRFCIGRNSDLNYAEISDGAAVANAELMVAGRCGYDDGNVGGGSSNTLIIANGAVIYASSYDQVTDGGGVCISGKTGATSRDNLFLVEGEGSLADWNNRNFNISFMQMTSSTGIFNRAEARNGGTITNIANVYVGRSSASQQENAFNDLRAGKDGNIFINGKVNVGTVKSSYGNRITIAGGKISAGGMTVASNNGVGVELGNCVPVPAEFSGTVTFEPDTYIYPSLCQGVDTGTGGVVLRAAEIIDNGLSLEPGFDPACWKLIVTRNEISLYNFLPGTVILFR